MLHVGLSVYGYVKCSSLLKWDNFASEMLYSKQGEESSQIIKNSYSMMANFKQLWSRSCYSYRSKFCYCRKNKKTKLPYTKPKYFWVSSLLPLRSCSNIYWWVQAQNGEHGWMFYLAGYSPNYSHPFSFFYLIFYS